MYKVTSIKKLRELLEEERKLRKQKEDEVLKFKTELERKTRLLSTYKRLPAVSHLAIVEARNSNAVPVMVLREDELRQKLEFNIRRLKESEKKCEELVARLDEVNRKYEAANNGVINQQLLVQQLQALNVEKTNEIKQLQKTINESKIKQDNGASTIQPRYVSSLKNAIAFGELLLEKKVPLPKQKKHWISNAQIWLEQIGEKKIKIDIKEKTDDKEAGDCNDSSSVHFEEFQSSSESVKGSIMPLQKSNDSINSPTSWSDEGVGLSPQLSVISMSSNFSERTTFSCSSRDSGIADCNKSTTYNNSVNSNDINYSSDHHNKLICPKSIDKLIEKENNSNNNDSKKDNCLSSSDVSVTLAEQKMDSLNSFKLVSTVEKPQILFNDLKSIFDPVFVCEDKKLNVNVEESLDKYSEKEESKSMKKDVEIKKEAEVQINCLHNNAKVEYTDVTSSLLGFESVHDTNTNSLLQNYQTDANKSTVEGDMSLSSSIPFLPQSSIGIFNDNETPAEVISSSVEVNNMNAVSCEENTSSVDKCVRTDPISVSDISLHINQDINMKFGNKESLDSDSHHCNSDTSVEANTDLKFKCNINQICKDLAVVYSTELIDNTGTIEILKPKLNNLCVVKINKFQQESDKLEKHCDHHYSVNCCSKNKTECKSVNNQSAKNIEDVVCSEITAAECFDVSKFDDKHKKHVDSNSSDVISMSSNNCDAVSSLDVNSLSEEKNNTLNVILSSPNKRNSVDTLICNDSSDACKVLFTDKNMHIVDAESRVVEESSECLLVNSEINSKAENPECYIDINSYNNADCLVTDNIEGSITDLELDLEKRSDIILADDKNNGTEILVHEIRSCNLSADIDFEQAERTDSDYIVSNISERNGNQMTEVKVMEEDSVSLNCMSENSNDCNENNDDDDDMEELLPEIKDIISFCNIRMLSPMSPMKGKMEVQCNQSQNVENVLDGTLEFPRGKTEYCTLNNSSTTLITAVDCTDEEKLSVDDDHVDAVLKSIFNDVFCPSPLSSPTDGSDISSFESTSLNKDVDGKSFSNVKVVNEINITEILSENVNLNKTEQNVLRTVSDDKEICLKNKQTNDLYSVSENNDGSDKQNDLTLSDVKEICLKSKQTNDLYSVNENNDSSDKQNALKNDLTLSDVKEICLKSKQTNDLYSVSENNDSSDKQNALKNDLTVGIDREIYLENKLNDLSSVNKNNENSLERQSKSFENSALNKCTDPANEVTQKCIERTSSYFVSKNDEFQNIKDLARKQHTLMDGEEKDYFNIVAFEKCFQLLASQFYNGRVNNKSNESGLLPSENYSKQNSKDLDNSIIMNSDVPTITSSQNTRNHNEYICEYANKLETVNTDQIKSIASVCSKSPARPDDSEVSSQIRRSSRLYLKSLKKESDSVNLENKENISKKNELYNNKLLKQESKGDIPKNRNLSRVVKKEICEVSTKFVDLKELPDLDLSQLTNKPCNRISCRNREKLSKLDRSRRKISRFSRNNSHEYCSYCCKDSVDKKDSSRESCVSPIKSELTENIILKHSGDVSTFNNELLDEDIVMGVPSTLHEGVIPESTSRDIVFTTDKDQFDGACKSNINMRTSNCEIENEETSNKSKIMKMNCIKNKEYVAVNNINKKETKSGHSAERCQQNVVINNLLENIITSENEKVVISSDETAKDGILRNYLLKPSVAPIISQLPDTKHEEIEKHNFPSTDSLSSNYKSISVKSEVTSNMEKDKPVASKTLTSDSVLRNKSKVKRLQSSTSEASKSVKSLKHLLRMRNKCNIKKQCTFVTNNNCIKKDPVITPSEREAQVFKNNISENEYELEQSTASDDKHISNLSSNYHYKLPDLTPQSNKYLQSVQSNDTKPKCMIKMLPDLPKDEFSEIISKSDDKIDHAKDLKSVIVSNNISVTVPSSPSLVHCLTSEIDFRQSLNKQRYSQINVNGVKSGSLLQKTPLPEDALKLPSHSQEERYQISSNGQVLLQSHEVGDVISPLTHSSKDIFLEESGHNVKSDKMDNDSTVYPNFYTSNNASKKRKLDESVEDDISYSRKCPKIYQEINDVNIEKEEENFLETNVKTNYRDIRFTEEKVNCERNIIDAALNFHKNSLLALTEAEILEVKKKEGKDHQLAESILGAVQKLACEDKPLTKEFLDQTIKKLKVCGPKSIAEMIIDLLCVDNGNLDRSLNPSLTPIQQYLFPVAYNLCNSDDYQDFLHMFLLSVKTTLFTSTDVCMVEPSKHLSRFSTLLCRSLAAFEEMRWFMYDVLYMLRFKALPIIFTMLTQWPDLLPYANAGKDCPLSFCISHVINNQSVDKQHTPLYKVHDLRMLLKRVYKYKLGEMSSDQVFEKLLSMIANKGFIDAVILLCKREGCSWTTEKVIKKSFLPMLESWKKGNIDDDKAAVIIITLGYILRPFPQDVDGEVIHEVLSELDRILTDEKGCPVVQEAAAISACHLSRSDFSACVNMLKKWTPKNGEVSRNVIETMKYFICKKKPVWWQKVLSG